MTPEQGRLTNEAMRAGDDEVIETVNATTGTVTQTVPRSVLLFQSLPEFFYRIKEDRIDITKLVMRPMNCEEWEDYAVSVGRVRSKTYPQMTFPVGLITGTHVVISYQDSSDKHSFEKMRDMFTKFDGSNLETET